MNAKGEPKALPKDAVIYTIPANVDLKVDYEGRTLLSETVEISQNGITFGLDPKLFTDKRQPSMALFNPATGALVKIAAVSAAGE